MKVFNTLLHTPKQSGRAHTQLISDLSLPPGLLLPPSVRYSTLPINQSCVWWLWWGSLVTYRGIWAEQRAPLRDAGVPSLSLDICLDRTWAGCPGWAARGTWYETRGPWRTYAPFHRQRGPWRCTDQGSCAQNVETEYIKEIWKYWKYNSYQRNPGNKNTTDIK